MAKFTLPGITATFVGDTPDFIDDIALEIFMPDGQNTFTYSIDVATPGEFPLVDIDINDLATLLGGILIDESSPFDVPFDVSLGSVNWGAGNTTVVLDLTQDFGFTEVSNFFVLGGAPLPAFANAAAFADFVDNQVTAAGQSGGAFAPGASISLAAVPGVTESPLPDVIPGPQPQPEIGEKLPSAADADQIADFLFGDASISGQNFSYTGALRAIRLLPDGHVIRQIDDNGDPIPGGAQVSIGRSIFLSSGGLPGEENTQTSFSVTLGEPGDDDLTEVAKAAFPFAGQTNDASIVEFTFNVPAASPFNAMTFDVIFGSDEFPEYSDTQYVDIAAVFVNGVNYALFNGDPNQPLSVIDTNISLGNFIDNNFQGPAPAGETRWSTEYDGFSPRLTVLAPVQPGQNTVKIGVADTGDSNLDSGLFIGNVRATSGSGAGVFTPIAGTTGNDTLQGGDGPEIFFTGPGNNIVFPGLGNDVINLGPGANQILGTLAELNGDVISGFNDNDLLKFLGVLFGPEALTVTPGSAILDIDIDGDGESDATVTLDGDFDLDTVQFNVSSDGGDTVITVEGVTPPGVLLTGTTGNDTLEGGLGNDTLEGVAGNNILRGIGGNNLLQGGDGFDTLVGGPGNDTIFGGLTEANLRDVVFAGDGDDLVFGGHGNDEIHGMGGNDTLSGGFGADSIFGGAGDDVINGGAFSDLIFGGAGDDFINGGFGSDRLNGGAGADTFFHQGVPDHGSDWIQDYNAAEGDVLMFGQESATIDQFLVQVNNTPNAGSAAVAEAFVVYIPNAQVIFALVDGMANSSINLQIAGNSTVYDLLA